MMMANMALSDEAGRNTLLALPIRISISLFRLPLLVNTTPRRCLNFSSCCSLLPLTCSTHCHGFTQKHNTSFFLVMMFIPAWIARSWKPITWMLKAPFRGCRQHQMVRKKQKVDPAAPNSDTLADSAVTVYPIHTDFEKEWWQHTPLSESNIHGERLWFKLRRLGHTLLSRNETNWRPITGGRQLRTPATLTRLFQRDPVVCFLNVVEGQ